MQGRPCGVDQEPDWLGAILQAQPPNPQGRPRGVDPEPDWLGGKKNKKKKRRQK